MPSLTCSDSNTFRKIHNEYFSITDLAGLGAFYDGIYCGLHKIIIDCYLKPYLFKEIHLLYNPSVGFSETLLLAAA